MTTTFRATLAATLAGLAVGAAASASHAGANQGAVAFLSWSATTQVTDTACALSNRVFVRVTRTTALSFKGAEVDLTWDPASNFTGCMDHLNTIYKTSTGTTCTYLNRGTAVPVVTSDDVNHFHVAWSNTLALTSCTQGAIIEVDFETDGCAPCGGCMSLNSVVLLDSASLLDYAVIGNAVITLGGGGGHLCQGVTPAAPTTWGHVKSLYRL